ncbi:hypothetical protein UA08_01153 [Talaromyces atroroseus]|uniref:DUF7907 domain-containing protein n=1 Tax=Talaromyces atroroseus TaxID=1441469 RepID=A0A1Q5Q9Y7_TALAT|nr:hypothetical protein UA08_01153 [Talaromyces atroroseus]OKL62701.1 hypothetical protein UA08_01153 [Talaromyces atroroseus]
MAVLGQNKTYYLQSTTGEYLSYLVVSEGIEASYLEANKSEAYPAYIDSSGHLTLKKSSSTSTVTLSDEIDGQDNLYGVLLNFGTATTGFAFASNGTLTVSQSNFKGFFACDNGDYGKQLFWSASAISAPASCEGVTFARVST